MGKIKVCCDSTCDLTRVLYEQNNIHVVPLTIALGDELRLDSVNIDADELFEYVARSGQLPKTSAISIGEYLDVFGKYVSEGYSVIHINLSSLLSSSHQNACLAAAELENIYVVDSESVAIGGGILVERALQLLDEGLDAKMIAETLEEEKKKIVIIALVDTLEYLKRGGRVSKTVAFAGTLLNIKPVLALIGGEIQILGKARGSKQGNNLLVQEIEKAGGVDFDKPVLLGYTGLTDALLQKYMEDSKHLWEGNLDEIRYTTIGSVIGTHAGPGAVAVAFFKK